MSVPTVDEFKEMDDPWINYFLSEQERLSAEMDVSELMHMAGSFGRPGSMTEGGQRYSKQRLELDAVTLRFTIYCLAKGIIPIYDIRNFDGETPPMATDVAVDLDVARAVMDGKDPQ